MTNSHPPTAQNRDHDLPVTVSNNDAMVVAQIAACLHARLDWKQADACAVDVFFMLQRKGLLALGAVQ